ncbi:hypothetical protein DEO72_LG8g1008 [Vigna unguiculata]|uniref:Uncharacterized protein n=1 Tax=Vigna unguiculata TaxID=3917 RepID=A0A4D6MQR1_VIGUN|nr:hypothetical protein DEO72_LG8g1008 [Vigna unguiculata]
MLVCSSFMVLTSTVVCPSLVLHRSPPVMFRSVTVVLYSAGSTSLVTIVAEYASPVVGVVESAQFVTSVVGFAPLAIGAAGFALLVEEILQRFSFSPFLPQVRENHFFLAYFLEQVSFNGDE